MFYDGFSANMKRDLINSDIGILLDTRCPEADQK